jgi:ABC-2 type transport system ATP-binding protein
MNYPGKEILKEISFEVLPGRIHGFLGPNGAGKSTTLKIIAGLLTPSSGNVFVGPDYNILEHPMQTKELIGILPETPPLMLDMQVKEYLIFVAKLYRIPHLQAKKMADQIIEKLRLGEYQNYLIAHLSKGYKQKVGLAQAMVFNPKIIILDEPTVGLDPQSVIEMRTIIKELKNNHTVLFSSHQLHEVELICDDITIIDKGKIKASGTMEEIKIQQLSQARILCHVKKFGPEYATLLRNEFHCDLKFSHEGSFYRLILERKSWSDDISKVAQSIVKHDLDLLELRLDNIELEELFTKITNSL